MTGTPIPTLFYGGRDTEASVLTTNSGFDDNGAVIVPLARSNPVAPAGASGEAIFKNVYVTITHSMAVDVRFTPILDFVPLDGTGGQPDERTTITLPGLPARLTERFEIGLSVPFPITGPTRFRNALRGVWFQIQAEAIGGLAAGDLIFDQTEIEFEVVRESVVAETP
ncbi:MAG: hypothetical protein KAJ42_15200 [Gemmatimonadetes bacterium]|nr:hypothetical protein [Gemmatimonadota bacterium]